MDYSNDSGGPMATALAPLPYLPLTPYVSANRQDTVWQCGRWASNSVTDALPSGIAGNGGSVERQLTNSRRMQPACNKIHERGRLLEAHTLIDTPLRALLPPLSFEHLIIRALLPAGRFERPE